MILMIDNYDSFTYNLVQYLGEIGEEVKVVRNDQIGINEIKTITELGSEIPILGVCLGHQSIGQAYGGKIIKAQEVMHGKTSMVHHHNKHVFEKCDNPFTATRYHSLVIEKQSIPDCLEVTAWTENDAGDLDEIMGVRHKELAVEGVQFHPESILTDFGHHLLTNFVRQN